MRGIAGPHWVRYGTAADQKYLTGDFVDSYDQLVVNARMVAHMPSALASFLLQRAKNKPYLIDPETHAFQQDLEYLTSTSESGGIKRSINKLANAYGPPITTRVLDQQAPVIPRDFADKQLLSDFCQRVLAFQHDQIRIEANDSDAAKYYRFRDPETSVKAFGPAILVAPYFHLTATSFRAWLPINIELARAAKTIADAFGCPLAVQVVLSFELLADRESLDLISDSYKDLAADCFLLWMDRFHENRASAGQLTSLVNLFNRLGAKTPVVNLYGGFFSSVLQRNNIARLAAVTHGLEYGEGRSVIPVGGGVPVSKFYLPAVRSRLVFREAYRAVEALGGFDTSDTFFQNVCNCRECLEVIEDPASESFYTYGRTKTLPATESRRRAIEFPTQETKNHCVRHYMFVKEQEFSASEPVSETIAALTSANSRLEGILAPESVAHCEIWARVLSELTAR